MKKLSQHWEATKMKAYKGTREAFVAGLMELAEQNPRVVLVSADSVKAARVTPFVERYPDRYFEAGIAEQNAVGMAAGLASCGLMPFVATYGGFITMRACEQLRTFVAYPELNVKFVGLNAGLIGGEREGVTHQFFEDLGIVRSIPGITIVAPADGAEVFQATKAIARINGPSYLRIGSGREPDVFDDDIAIEIGKIRIIKQYGTDAVIFANGFILNRVLKAAECLAKEGVKTTVAEVHTLKPVDVAGIVALLEQCRAAITVEDHNIIGGLGSMIAEVSAEHRPTPLLRLGLRDVFPQSGPADVLADHYHLSVQDIIAGVKQIRAKKK
jgi:transketolase